MHYYTDIITHGRPFLTSRRHWWERVNYTVIESYLSVTSGSSRAQTWTAGLTDRDAITTVLFPRPQCSWYNLYRYSIMKIHVLGI